MTKFDLISVLVSIVFGLGLTHLCSGAFQLAYRRALGAVSFLFAGLLFPPSTDTDIDSETRHRGLAIALFVTIVLDIIQTGGT